MVVPYSRVELRKSCVWTTDVSFCLFPKYALLAHKPLHQIEGHRVVRVITDNLIRVGGEHQ